MTEVEIILDYASRGLLESFVVILLFISSASAICALSWLIVKLLEDFYVYKVELKQLEDDTVCKYDDENIN